MTETTSPNVVFYRCGDCKARTAARHPDEPFYSVPCKCGGKAVPYGHVYDPVWPEPRFSETLALILKGMLTETEIIDLRGARAAQDALTDRHVLAVLKRFGGTVTGKQFQTFAPGDTLRDWIAYPDLKKSLVRLEKAGEVAVDRDASKGPSKWVITRK